MLRSAASVGSDAGLDAGLAVYCVVECYSTEEIDLIASVCIKAHWETPVSLPHPTMICGLVVGLLQCSSPRLFWTTSFACWCVMSWPRP